MKGCILQVCLDPKDATVAILKCKIASTLSIENIISGERKSEYSGKG